MSIKVHPFTNFDTPALVRVWREHYQGTPIPSACPTNVWDYCIISKPFFNPESLWIAWEEEQPRGFLHATFAPNADRSDQSQSIAILNALCVSPVANDAEIAACLLEVADRYFFESGSQRAIATSSPNDFAFYLGIAPGDGLLGVPEHDSRLKGWLENAGFQAGPSTVQWSVDLRMFRAPMDRTQIQVRRQCQVSRILEDLTTPWWTAACLGHIEQVRFQLTTRQPPFQAVEALFWQPDSTIHGIQSQGMSVWIPIPAIASFPADECERIVFLLAESLRQLQQDHVPQVQVTLYEDSPLSHRALERLGFAPSMRGTVYSKTYA